MSQLVQISNLRDYAKCPNYAKYNWDSKLKSIPKSICQKVIESCYSDLSMLDKTVDWKTVRNRVAVFAAESNHDAASFYNSTITILESLRNWYVSYYRDYVDSAVNNITLESSLLDRKIVGTISNVLVKNNQLIMIEHSENVNIFQDIGLKVKLWLLYKNNIKVKRVIHFTYTDKSVSTQELNIDNPDIWNTKTEQVLKLMLTSINNKIFYPSPTNMCKSCKYKDICSW